MLVLCLYIGRGSKGKQNKGRTSGGEHWALTFAIALHVVCVTCTALVSFGLLPP